MTIRALLTFFVITLFCAAARADVVYLKNGNNMEGIIVKETDSEITLDVGMGTISMDKNEIKDIKRASGEAKIKQDEALKENEIERGDFVPQGMSGIAERFQELKKNKQEIDRARSRLEGLKGEFELKKENFALVTSELRTKNDYLKTLNPNSDIAYYNSIIAEVNAVNGELSSLSAKLNNISEKIPDYGKAMHIAITAYADNIEVFRKYFEAESATVGVGRLSEDENRFFMTIKRAVDELEKSLKKDSVSLVESSGNLLTSVKINGKLNCIMVVDTGASVVTITREAARKLNLSMGNERNKSEAVLADGSKVRTESVILESVEVGSSKANGVLAAVMDKPPAAGVEGLLGMSFLENFGVKIDSANKKLILETVK